MQLEDEICQTMTTAEKITMAPLTLIMVRGKRGCGVPVLLTPDMRESIDLLIDFHKQGSEMPTFIFARTAGAAMTPLRAYDCMSELATKAELDQPENIRATKLQKHIATVYQVLALKKTELEQLANHMGHNIQIHREYYRLPQESLMLAKVSKLLILADKGKLHEYAGKSLDEIEIYTPEDVIDDELVDGEEDEEEECEADMEENEAANPEDEMEDGAGPSSSSNLTLLLGENTTSGRNSRKNFSWLRRIFKNISRESQLQENLKAN